MCVSACSSREPVFGCRCSAPAGGHKEADEGDAETDDQVPRADARDRECRPTEVEDQHPYEPDQHEADHHGLEPDGVGGRFARAPLDELLVLARSCHEPSLLPAGHKPPLTRIHLWMM